VDLKIVLGEINANSDKCFDGRSPSLWRYSRPPLWHFDAVEERPSTSSVLRGKQGLKYSENWGAALSREASE